MRSIIKKLGKKGFTLVELMVVLLIIGILVAIALALFSAITDAANRRACQANLRTLDSANIQYLGATEKYANGQPNLVSCGFIAKSYECPRIGLYTWTVLGVGVTQGFASCVTYGASGHIYR